MTAINEIMTYGKRAQGRKELIKHYEEKSLIRSEAIKAKCYDCMGMYADGVCSCEIPECPLFPFNPYSKVKPVEVEAQED